MTKSERVRLARAIKNDIDLIREIYEQNTNSIALFMKATQVLLNRSLRLIEKMPLDDPELHLTASAMIDAWRTMAEMQQVAVADQIEAMAAVRNQLKRIQTAWGKKWQKLRLSKNGKRTKPGSKHQKRRS